MNKIECVDCGVEVQARTKRRKYCALCGLHHRLIGTEKRGKLRCYACKKWVAPITSADKLCGECYVLTHPTRGEAGTCNLCKQEGRIYDARARVCPTCLYDPAMRDRVARATARAWHKAVQSKSGDVVSS